MLSGLKGGDWDITDRPKNEITDAEVLWIRRTGTPVPPCPPCFWSGPVSCPTPDVERGLAEVLVTHMIGCGSYFALPLQLDNMRRRLWIGRGQRPAAATSSRSSGKESQSDPCCRLLPLAHASPSANRIFWTLVIWLLAGRHQPVRHRAAIQLFRYGAFGTRAV